MKLERNPKFEKVQVQENKLEKYVKSEKNLKSKERKISREKSKPEKYFKFKKNSSSETETMSEIVDYATSVKKCGMAERVPIFRNEAKPSGENGMSSHFALFCTRYIYAIFCNKCEKRTQNCVKKRTFLH